MPKIDKRFWFAFLLFPILFLAACNLGGAPEEDINITDVPTSNVQPTRTPVVDNPVPTSQQVTSLPIPTSQVQFPSTVVAQIPTQSTGPVATSLPVSIFIVSPIPGNVVAGSVQVVGSATHPQFLQYRLEFASDPNPNNLWFPITGDVRSPVTNDFLGSWNTTTTQDGKYQLRLRVFLTDGTEYGNVVVNDIRVQNTAPTPVPTNTPVIPRPVAAFTQDHLAGIAPLIVRFTSQSQGQIDSYAWNFGDGSTSAERDPVHTFNRAGTFTVTLTVSGPGGTSNVSRLINVRTPAAPVASFVPDKTSGESPLRVQFTSTSTGQIDEFAWDFGDGQTSFGPNVIHDFVNEGTYNVILRVTGPGGSSSATRQITVEDPAVPPPVAAFTPNTTVSGQVPLTVDFVSTSTGEIETHQWNFGDGSPTNFSQNPRHTFSVAGNFTVVLTVVGPGGQDSAEVSIQVTRPPDAPIANFTITGDTVGEAPLRVVFNNTSSGQIDTTSWNFGDGQTSNSSDSVVTHNFQQPGTYNVILTVSNESGSDTATATINVLTPLVPPDAEFTANPTSGPAPLDVEFRNQSSGDDLSFTWDFGDGQTSNTSEAILEHTYEDAGTYTAKLTARNQQANLVDEFELTITVSEEVSVAPVNADFSITEVDDFTFEFEATANGGTGTYSYSWDFGDGNGKSVGSSNETVTYSAGAEYLITLTVDDGSGNPPVVVQHPITVTEPTPALSADFTASETAPLFVEVSASASGGTGVYSYAWDFGDGNGVTASGQNASVTYAAGAEYLITLTVDDGSGNPPVVVQHPITVTEPTPALSADFTASETAPLFVEVSASASGGTGVYSYAWDFGDGNGVTASGQTASVTYPAGAEYLITLTVDDGSGNPPVVVQHPITVTEPTPALSADFTASETAPLFVEVSASASGGTGVYSYAWDFGDGNGVTANGQNASVTYAAGAEYLITLTVDDGSGNPPVVVQHPITVTEPTPALSADFTASETAPLFVEVSASASGGTGVYSYAWDFGDGNGVTANGQNASVTYAAGAEYLITLTVDDGSGNPPVVVQHPITVTEPTPALTADFTASETAPLFVEVSASASGGTGVYSYAWDFGDGNGVTASGQNASVTYAAGAEYLITLTVDDGSGNPPVVVQHPITVTEPTPALTADFTASETSPLFVEVSASASGGTGVYSYAWDFGDGNGVTASGQNASVTYAAGAEYLITLTVDDGSGNPPVVVQHPITVTEPTPALTADFTASETAPLFVEVSASASGGTGVYSYAWDFGDGNGVTASGQTASVTYPAGAEYLVTLTVDDGSGNPPITVQKTITVTAPSQEEEAPVIPRLDEILPSLDSIFQTGQNTGTPKATSSFALIGDQMASLDSYLAPLGSTDTYRLEGDAASLQSVVDLFSAEIPDLGENSFTRKSPLTVADSVTVAALQTVASDPACLGGETWYICELRLTNASIALIQVGRQDVLQMTDPNAFEGDYFSMLQSIANTGTIPVAFTVYPTGDPNFDAQLSAINEAIITSAGKVGVPVVNQWLALSQLPNNGLSGGTPSVSADPLGAGLISESVQEGANTRNLLTLSILNALVEQVYP